MASITPSEAMVETLRLEGVKHVPGIVGSAFMDALDLFPAAGIDFVPVRHEQTAGHMADAYARITGAPAVCIGQNGPGVTNMVTSIAAAYHAHSPVVIVTPTASTASVGLDGFQEAEQLCIFRAITKYQIQVPRPERMAESFRTAFRMALARRGPVQVDIPRDFFYGETDEPIELPERSRGTSRAAPDEASILQAAQLLADARHPVVLAGMGVVESEAQREVAELAEMLTAPVATTYLHNDAFPASHHLAVGPIGYQGSKAAMQLLSEADVVLALGTRINVFGTVPQYGLDFWPSEAQIIQVDVDATQLGRSKPIALGITGDAQLAARGLLDRLRERGGTERDASRLEHIARRREAWELELEQASQETAAPISPRRALRDLAEVLPDDAVVTTDIGNVCSVSNAYWRFERPRTFLAALGFGNCGFAYPAALGAKLARPDQPVVAVIGDGAWGMSLHETMTAVEQELPVVAVVYNNGQWGAEKRNQIDFYDDRFVGTDIGAGLDGFDFAAIATAMGADGRRVEDPADLTEAYRDALDSTQPTVLDVRIDPEELAEPFRRDALQAPVRLLDRYRSLSAR